MCIRDSIETEIASVPYLLDEVEHVSLCSGALPLVFACWNDSLLAQSDKCLHLDLPSFNEVESVTVCISTVVDNLVCSEELRPVEHSTHILNDVEGEFNHHRHLHQSLEPVSLLLLSVL